MVYIKFTGIAYIETFEIHDLFYIVKSSVLVIIINNHYNI